MIETKDKKRSEARKNETNQSNSMKNGYENIRVVQF